jgi:hypothetical protein
VIVTHDAPLEAVHWQPPFVDTDTDPLLAVDGTDALDGDRLYVQPLSCEIANVRPAMLSDP